jgi:hypothetical protein
MPLVIASLAYGRLDKDKCLQVLEERGFLHSNAYLVNLCFIPLGLTEQKLETFRRTRSVELSFPSTGLHRAARMITQNLARRLERLKQVTTESRVSKVWRIVILGTDGSRRDGPTIEWPRVGPGPTLSERFRDFEKTRLNEAGSK